MREGKQLTHEREPLMLEDAGEDDILGWGRRGERTIYLKGYKRLWGIFAGI